LSCEQELLHAIVKTKRELVLQKYQLGNGLKFTENEYLPKYELKFKCLENLKKPLALKSDIVFERVSIVCTLARVTKIQKG